MYVFYDQYLQLCIFFKKIKLDITPDKGWQNEDMFLPSGYHIDASVSGGEESPNQVGAVPYLFPAGIGSALMNGCWGTGYKPGDPCYAAKWTSDVCQVNALLRYSSLCFDHSNGTELY